MSCVFDRRGSLLSQSVPQRQAFCFVSVDEVFDKCCVRGRREGARVRERESESEREWVTRRQQTSSRVRTHVAKSSVSFIGTTQSVKHLCTSVLTFIGSMMANKPVLSGCDILNLFVDEAGAFNTRCLGSAALPMVLWKDGFEGEVPLQGVAGTIFVDIAPMEPASSGVPAAVEASAPVMLVEPSAPQAMREQDFAVFKAALPSEACSSSEG